MAQSNFTIEKTIHFSFANPEWNFSLNVTSYSDDELLEKYSPRVITVGGKKSFWRPTKIEITSTITFHKNP